METQTEKRMIETSGKLLAENGPGAFTLDVLSRQPEMQGFDIFNLARNEDEVFEQLLLQFTNKMVRDLKKYQSATD
jgi:hypothetical protein